MHWESPAISVNGWMTLIAGDCSFRPSAGFFPYLCMDGTFRQSSFTAGKVRVFGVFIGYLFAHIKNNPYICSRIERELSYVFINDSGTPDRTILQGL